MYGPLGHVRDLELRVPVLLNVPLQIRGKVLLGREERQAYGHELPPAPQALPARVVRRLLAKQEEELVPYRLVLVADGHDLVRHARYGHPGFRLPVAHVYLDQFEQLSFILAERLVRRD